MAEAAVLPAAQSAPTTLSAMRYRAVLRRWAFRPQYHIATAKVPMATDVNGFRFDGAPVDETPVCNLPAIMTAVRLGGIYYRVSG